MSIYLALSSNLDDPLRRILDAFDAIAAHPDLKLLACSSVYRTRPWGYTEQPDFWNAACEIDTPLGPHDLLLALQSLEKNLGRTPPPVRWGPRRIDLDLLLYHDRRIEQPDLAVPHPLIRERAFVLVPLLEIAPDLRDPLTGTPYSVDLARVKRPGDVEWVHEAPAAERHG